ncbi:alpha-hydroxy acid oxidase [Falsiroseomonas sp. HW251]|uniref:alpha-hydroxy acid oxidase n=1 Tax=Falsiroseomonas sp. HW251 TaxID=3390998 RepID=UPI003D310EAB
MRALAHRRLPRFVVDYLEGGAGRGLTLARNRAALDAIALVPRTLRDVSEVSLATRLFGLAMAAPLMIAPTGVAGLLRPGADVMLARAAARLGLPFVLSAASNVPVEDVAAQGGLVWMQVYPLRDREATRRLVARATKAGCVGIVLTVDTPVAGVRHWEARHFTPAGRPRLRTRLDALRHPAWLMATLRHGPPRFPNIGLDVTGLDERAERKAINEGKDPAFTFDDLAILRDACAGRLVVKGLAAPEDVERIAALGADGAIISNHGGRQLDGMVSTVEALPACLQAAGAMPLMLDGGIRDGVDVAKVLALGAKAVLVGRVPLYGLAAAGEDGVAHALSLLTKELDRVLALVGCRDVTGLDRRVLSGRCGSDRDSCLRLGRPGTGGRAASAPC